MKDPLQSEKKNKKSFTTKKTMHTNILLKSISVLSFCCVFLKK